MLDESNQLTNTSPMSFLGQRDSQQKAHYRVSSLLVADVNRPPRLKSAYVRSKGQVSKFQPYIAPDMNRNQRASNIVLDE